MKFIGIYFLANVQIAMAQIASTSGLLSREDYLLISPSDIFSTPQNLGNIWIENPIPLSYYDDEEIETQKRINQRQVESIVTFSPLDKRLDQIDIDHSEITPYTWKWVDLEQTSKAGTTSQVSLRRPNSWIKEIGADSIGKKVDLHMPEMGVNGKYVVRGVRPNQLDTRLWDLKRDGDYVTRPITGKFTHYSDDIYELYFENSEKPLGVTGNHLFWSQEIQKWIPARDLGINEIVKTYNGSVKLIKRVKNKATHRVYNLEVYKDHNYNASLNTILVHNGCLKMDGKWLDMASGRLPMLQFEQKTVRIFYKDFSIGSNSSMEDLAADFTHLLEEAVRSEFQQPEVLIRFGENIVSKIKNIPKDGSEYIYKHPVLGYERRFYTTYDTDKKILQFSNFKNNVDDYNGFGGDY